MARLYPDKMDPSKFLDPDTRKTMEQTAARAAPVQGWLFEPLSPVLGWPVVGC